MGVQLYYNEFSQMWELKGWGFVWSFRTKEDAEANRKRAWEEHTANLRAFQTVHGMLVAFR